MRTSPPCSAFQLHSGAETKIGTTRSLPLSDSFVHRLPTSAQLWFYHAKDDPIVPFSNGDDQTIPRRSIKKPLPGRVDREGATTCKSLLR